MRINFLINKTKDVYVVILFSDKLSSASEHESEKSQHSDSDHEVLLNILRQYVSAAAGLGD